jgi:hypothetical protein
MAITPLDEATVKSSGITPLDPDPVTSLASKAKVNPYAGMEGARMLVRALRGTPGGVWGEGIRAAEAGLGSLIGRTPYEQERNAIRTEEGLSLDPEKRAKQIEEIQKQGYSTDALGVVGVASPLAGAAGRGPLAQSLASRAERAAVRSGYGDRTAFRKAFKGSDERIQDTGRFLLDEKVPLNPKGMRDTTAEIMHGKGGAGEQVSTLSAATPGAVDLAALKNKVLSGEQVGSLNKSTLTRPEFKAIEEFFDDQISQHGTVVSPEKIHEIRQLIDKAGANWTSATKDVVNNAWKEARHGVSGELGTAMQQGGAGPEWTAANKRYENAAAANRISTTGAERVGGNQFLRPSEKAAALIGGAGAMYDKDIRALGLPLAYMALNRFAMPVAARGMNAMSKLPLDYLGHQVGVRMQNEPQTQEELLAEILRQKENR